MKIKFKIASNKEWACGLCRWWRMQQLRKLDALHPHGGRLYEDLVLLAPGFYMAREDGAIMLGTCGPACQVNAEMLWKISVEVDSR